MSSPSPVITSRPSSVHAGTPWTMSSHASSRSSHSVSERPVEGSTARQTVTLLARTQVGYTNLCRILTAAHMRGEEMRQAFESRLDKRTPDVVAAPAASGKGPRIRLIA